ncbi:MAG TPA: exodeoxyribonuclease III [Vicinamibacterales bacterium]|nr:exodeoxyribonuclease III [Vicinamibacterales bacterium]
MKIATWNVNGIRARAAQLHELVAHEQPDVLCLQEIKAAPSQLAPELCDLEGYWCYWHGERGYSGVGLHVRKATYAERPVFSHPPFDLENRVVVCQVQSTQGPLTVASTYVPNGGKDFPGKLRFLEAMENFAGSFRATGALLVICGDLNVARTDMDVHAKERKPRAIGQLPEERALIERLLAQGLVDIARKLHPDDAELFTWWAPWRNLRQRNIGWRIDYVLASDALGARARVFESQREFGTSDHAPVVTVFDWPLPARVDDPQVGRSDAFQQPRTPRLFA